MPAMKEQFKAALPPHIDVDKFVRVVMTAISTTPALVNADRSSLLSACLKSAADGLICDGKEAALVPFGKSVSYMPMMAGILKKIRNSGELSTITSEIVYKNDQFNYEFNTDGLVFSHKPNLFSDRGDPLGVYAMAKTKDGGVYFEFLSKDQVMDVRSVSKTASNGPWSGPFEDQMWKKTAIRRLSKRLPMSTDIDMTLHADDELFNPPETPVTNETKTVTESEPQTTTPPAAKKSKLKAAMEETVKDATPVQKIDTEEPPQVVSDEEIPI